MTMYAVRDPRGGTDPEPYPTATDEEIREAIDSAHETHAAWGRTTDGRRARRAWSGGSASCTSSAPRSSRTSSIREMGKPRDEAVGEVEFCAAIYDYYADNAEKFLADEPIELLDGTGTALIRRTSLGVLLGIMPWNFPAYQVARFAGPNLCTGNTIILKHAPQCPASAAALQQIFLDAGLPRGRLRQRLRRQRAGRDDHRRPPGPGRLAHRLGARGRRSRRDRRPQPEEGGARAGRVRPVHRAEQRRHGRHRRGRRRRARLATPARPATPASASSSWTTSTTSSSRRSPPRSGQGRRPPRCRSRPRENLEKQVDRAVERRRRRCTAAASVTAASSLPAS